MYRVLVRIPGVASAVQNYVTVPQNGDTLLVQSRHVSGSGVVSRRELHPIVDGQLTGIIVELDGWIEESDA